MVASTSENSSDRKNGLILNRSVLASIVSRSIFLQRGRCFLSGSLLDLLHEPVPVALDAIEREAELRARHRIHRHQRRMRKALVEVFDDDARVVEHEIAVHQRRHAVVRIEIEQVLGKSPGLDAHDVDADALLREHDARAVTPRIVGSREQRHDGSSARQDIAPGHWRRSRLRRAVSGRLSSIPSSAATRAR